MTRAGPFAMGAGPTLLSDIHVDATEQQKQRTLTSETNQGLHIHQHNRVVNNNNNDVTRAKLLRFQAHFLRSSLSSCASKLSPARDDRLKQRKSRSRLTTHVNTGNTSTFRPMNTSRGRSSPFEWTPTAPRYPQRRTSAQAVTCWLWVSPVHCSTR